MDPDTPADMIFKVIALGDAGVGKTSLLLSYFNDRGSSSAKPTIGVDCLRKVFYVKGKEMALQLWDTAGQERYGALSEGLFRGSKALVLVFDLSTPVSFNNLDHWYQEFFAHVDIQQGKRFPIVVVGNKSDASALVEDETIKEWCKSKGAIPFFYTSAKEGTNVQEPFHCIARDCLSIYHPEEIQSSDNPTRS